MWVWFLFFWKLLQEHTTCLGRTTSVQGARNLWGQRFCVIFLEICTPSLFPPLPSVVQLKEQNRHWTFDQINSWPPVVLSTSPTENRNQVSLKPTKRVILKPCTDCLSCQLWLGIRPCSLGRQIWLNQVGKFGQHIWSTKSKSTKRSPKQQMSSDN